MSIHQQLAGALAAVSLILLGFFPSNFTIALSFIASIMLYGFVSYIAKSEDSRIVNFEQRMKDLDEKMNTLMIGKGFNR